MEESILQTKSFDLSVAVHKKVAELQKKQKEFLLSQWWAESISQVALYSYLAHRIPAKRNFIISLYAARKAAHRGLFWTSVLARTEALDPDFAKETEETLVELVKLAQASISTYTSNHKKQGDVLPEVEAVQVS